MLRSPTPKSSNLAHFAVISGGPTLNADIPSSQSYSHATWRVILHPALDGSTNMAIDEALAEAVRDGLAPPTLRFYDWNPATLSLGYAQPAADVDTERLGARGWGLVRRLTGGRAILHVDELTYSVTVPAADPRVTGGVVESYRRLSRGLMAGLVRLGAAVESSPANGDAHGFKGPVCFEVPSDYEITVGGKKLIGSAQTRRGGGEVVLQHGALPLYGDVARICEALAFPDDAAREAARVRVRERAATLEEALGRAVSFAEAAQAMTDGFAEALNVTLVPGDLSTAEQARAEALREEKYAAEAWTGKL